MLRTDIPYKIFCIYLDLVILPCRKRGRCDEKERRGRRGGFFFKEKEGKDRKNQVGDEKSIKEKRSKIL